MQDIAEFTLKIKDMIVGEALDEINDENMSRFLARVSNTVRQEIPKYLIEKIDVDGMIKGIKIQGTLEEKLKALKSPGTSRKIGNYIKEDDKKLRKLLQDVAKVVLVWNTLRDDLPLDFPVGRIESLSTQPRYEEEHINFTVKYGKWIVVKRLIIDEKTPMLDIARLLASINESAVGKIPEFAGIDMKEIKDYFGGFKRVRKDEEIEELVRAFRNFKPENELAIRYAVGEMLSKLGLSIDVPSKNLEKYLEKTG
ncbi:DUF2666 family protein [Pyrococcus abyssi]|uniref:DUF2666 domain-containing protein n=1 Tax=Pyrococcus abyssi (strain GE5 / Orsay) TaxID=272844 RepID=Q9V2K3_PYRAB|nr:DUF2666 family protein [Pyrococcus abyssi]CAB48995.1 Hypothetical protein PAB0036 [Pyrococcus abyssi GE5]CCE69444.1 TPA: hypothetical protein PAB0036 [Pyrococcus abyssi GE5]